jgi:heme-degrading monooxygenase HmoA
MIIRIWCAKATVEGAKKYQHHFEQRVMPELQALAGFEGAYLLNREHDGTVDIEAHTLWGSFDAIHAFAKPDLEAAVVEPEAQAVLTEYDKTVRHFTALKFTK